MSNSTSAKSDKVCVVVGVGEGLGMALALRFAAGYKVALIARSADVIGKAAEQIKSSGGVALPIRSDATIEAEIAAAYERIKRELGPIEVLIYNGGRRPMGRLMDTTPQVFRGDVATAYAWRVPVGATGRPRHARSRQRRNSDHWRDCGSPAVANLRSLRSPPNSPSVV